MADMAAHFFGEMTHAAFSLSQLLADSREALAVARGIRRDHPVHEHASVNSGTAAIGCSSRTLLGSLTNRAGRAVARARVSLEGACLATIA